MGGKVPFEQMALFQNNCMCGIGFWFLTIFVQPAFSSPLSIEVFPTCFWSEWELLGTCLRRPKTDLYNFMCACCATFGTLLLEGDFTKVIASCIHHFY